MNAIEQDAPTLLVSRTIRAPRSRVFEAFSSIEELKRWFGPGECHVAGGEMEFEVGGSYRLDMVTQDFGNLDLIGTFQEIIDDERIVYSWQWQKHEVPEAWAFPV